MNEYLKFIEGKIAQAQASGFHVEQSEINTLLYPHQRDIVQWAVSGGRRAIFAKFGLGKTFMQLEALRLIMEHAPVVPGSFRKALIVCPLGVKQEFARDAGKLGIEIEYVRTNKELEQSKCDIVMTNYERVRDGKLDVSNLLAVSLDEASVLRGYGTKTYQEFLTLFPNVQYRFVCTATPSPNRYKELIHYAGFLGIMDTGQALTRFFQRDSTKANNLTLYQHKEKEFWLWMASWACFLSKPSDLGYSDDGYSLPPLNIHWHELTVDHADAPIDRDGQKQMFRDTAAGLKEASAEKRRTMVDRISKAKAIVEAEPDRHFILWHHQEAERHLLKKSIDGVVDVYGSQDLETREKRIIGFSDGEFKYLATKPVLSGSGCNFQRHCSAAVFVGIDYKFNDTIQAIHRIYRFQQTEAVDIHIIYAESEREVRAVLEEKWRRHEQLVEEMTAIIQKYGLSREAIENTMKRTIGIERQEEHGNRWTAINNDTVGECTRMDENSVDLICTSIPFGNHYEYSPSYNDFGHTDNNVHFFEQMDYLTPNLLRILKPGRVAAIHVKDRILFGNVTGCGMPTVDPFHAHTLFHFQKHGFLFFGMVTIETDVVRENNQTYRLGWTEQCKDGSKMGIGCPEYLLLFRKRPTDTSKAYADEKVSKEKSEYTRARWQIDARAKWNSSGDRLLAPEEIKALPIDQLSSIFKERLQACAYDYESHVAAAEALDAEGKLPATFQTLDVPARNDDVVWHDVNRMRTLNGEQTRKNLQNHICPLQFDIVDRVINRFSNKGELVFDPFGGIMTVPYRAVMMDRRGMGVELNTDYWRDGMRYLRGAEQKVTAPTLFDLEMVV